MRVSQQAGAVFLKKICLIHFLRRVSCRRVGRGGRDWMEVGDILIWGVFIIVVIYNKVCCLIDMYRGFIISALYIYIYIYPHF